MPTVEEVDVLKNWTLSIDHFYSIVKATLGEITSQGRYQIQATAIPLDVSDEYEWFSRGLINQAFNVALEPVPTSDSLAVGLQLRTSLSNEYRSFLSRALMLVETQELDDDVVKKIDELEVDIVNLEEQEGKLVEKLQQKWQKYADTALLNKGDIAANAHWLQGQSESFRLKEVRERLLLKVALQIGLRDQQYEDDSHKEVLEAYKKLASPAATMRYPRFEDTEYPEETQKLFNVVYFAGLESHDSNMFINEYMMTPLLSLDVIQSGTFGKTSSEISKESEAHESITTDWQTSVGGGWGPFKVRANVSSHEAIKTDFSTATSLTFSVEALMAIPFNADTWFNPSVFDNDLIKKNASIFERWLGTEGTLRIIPTHLVVCRGMKVTFHNEQEWLYDYESDFKISGSASAKVFGIGFGGGGSYQKHVERQQVERRGHDLSFSDGEDNIRIIGYHTVTNPVIVDKEKQYLSAFSRSAELAAQYRETLLARTKR